MDTPANKLVLWDLTKHFYQAWMDRTKIIALFEATVHEVDLATKGKLLPDRNNEFLSVYAKRVEALLPETQEARDAMFEERARNRLMTFRSSSNPAPKKSVSFDRHVDLDELREIRQAVADALARLDHYLAHLE
jgi:hypothetical protein